MTDQLSQAERTARETAVKAAGFGEPKMRRAWQAGRDYGREHEDDMRRGAAFLEGCLEKVEERERALLDALRWLLRATDPLVLPASTTDAVLLTVLDARKAAYSAVAASQPTLLSGRSDTEPGEPEGKPAGDVQGYGPEVRCESVGPHGKQCQCVTGPQSDHGQEREVIWQEGYDQAEDCQTEDLRLLRFAVQRLFLKEGSLTVRLEELRRAANDQFAEGEQIPPQSDHGPGGASELEQRQAAIDKAVKVMRESEYVGGPSERDAWRTAFAALAPFETEYKAMQVGESNG